MTARFTRLRDRSHICVFRELEKRLQEEPEATQEELDMGAYIQELEPQVRHAVLDLRRKGYQTHSSGFCGQHGEWQGIAGPLELESSTIEALRAAGMGVDVKKPDGYTWVLFAPQSRDLAGIAGEWAEVSGRFPDRGSSAPPSRNRVSVDFRDRDSQSPETYLQWWTYNNVTRDSGPHLLEAVRAAGLDIDRDFAINYDTLRSVFSNVNGLLVELGGPTPEGYDMLRKYRLELPGVLTVTNRSLQVVDAPYGDHSQTYHVDEVADIWELPYADRTVGLLLASHIPQTPIPDNSIGEDLIGESRNTRLAAAREEIDLILAGGHHRPPQFSLHAALLHGASRVLCRPGYLLLQGVRDYDQELARCYGLEPLLVERSTEGGFVTSILLEIN